MHVPCKSQYRAACVFVGPPSHWTLENSLALTFVPELCGMGENSFADCCLYVSMSLPISISVSISIGFKIYIYFKSLYLDLSKSIPTSLSISISISISLSISML